jgi:hypothetical protein
MRVHTLKLVSPLSLVFALSCTGLIGDPPNRAGVGVDGGSSDGGTGGDGGAVVPGVDPQRVTLHRLNRVEYNNTVRDLLGTRRRPADEFPADDRGYGFDNIAAVLSLSPLHLEFYDRTAELLINEAIGTATVPSRRYDVEGEMLMGSVGQAGANDWNLWSNGELPWTVTVPSAGHYRFTVRAWQDRAGADDAQMVMSLDGMTVQTVAVPNVMAMPGQFSVEVNVPRAGTIVLSVAFANDYYMNGMDRNLHIDWLRLEGPSDGAAMVPATRAQWLTCDPAMMGEDMCAQQILTRFARRAWRRPPLATEITALWTRFRAVTRMHAGTWEDAIKLSMRAMLVSPHFVFRVEVDPDLNATEAHALTSHELASRLSYFLWSSMPDATLDQLADQDQLQDPTVLRAQAERMLHDPKARALTENFAGQWLYIRALEEHAVNAQLYPAFTPEVRAGMQAESEAYFQHFLQEDVSMDQFLSADYTFVDERLASFYGVTLPAGMGVRRVALSGTNRIGVLMQGTTLAVTSHPDRTSPVKRGQWVLTQLLCAPPPPPPPNVEGLPAEMVPSGSLRSRLEAHRSQPLCRACHDLMDPIGFGLENFNAAGRYRTMDGTFAIDSTGVLPDGTRFSNGPELATAVQRDPRFARCVAQQLLTYALGRGLNNIDDAPLSQLATQWTAAGMRLSDLVYRVVLSPTFRARRPETP